jgi:two-component system, cell cycle sensor histidine kinase and response regulator CckA
MDIFKQKEKKIVQEKRFQGLFDTSPIGMSLVSPEGKWLKVNKSLAKILGYPQSELLQKTFQEITHPDDLDDDVHKVHQMLKGDITNYQIEKRYIHKDESIVWVVLGVSLVNDTDGKPLYFVSQVLDVTKQKEYETKLAERDKQFQLITEIVGEVFWMSTPGIAEMIYVSPSYEKVFGRTTNSLYNDPQAFAKAVHPQDQARVQAELKLHKKGIWSVDYRIIRPDGSVRWIQDRGKPIVDKAGEISMMVGAARDVTDVVEAEEKYKEKNLELQKMNKFLVGREMKLVELKDRIRELEEECKKIAERSTE